MIAAMTTADLPAEEPRRFTRSRDGRIVAGVCQGAGEYFDIDPVIFRVILAVLAVFGGAGIVLYGVAWLLIPEAGSPSTRLERWLEGRSGGRRRDIMIVIATLIAVMILANRSLFTHRARGVLVAVVLVLAVTALIGRRRSERSHLRAGPGSPTEAQFRSDRSTSRPAHRPLLGLPPPTPLVPIPPLLCGAMPRRRGRSRGWAG